MHPSIVQVFSTQPVHFCPYVLQKRHKKSTQRLYDWVGNKLKLQLVRSSDQALLFCPKVPRSVVTAFLNTAGCRQQLQNGFLKAARAASFSFLVQAGDAAAGVGYELTTVWGKAQPSVGRPWEQASVGQFAQQLADELGIVLMVHSPGMHHLMI